MKRTLISAALAAAAIVAIPAVAQMGGYGGYGMGPGMMGGYGMMGGGPGYGMGPGMMGGFYGPGAGYGADLTGEQRAKIAEIQEGFGKKQWALMQSMHQVGWNRAEAYRDGKLDESAARQSFEAMSELRKQMFENSLEARKQIDAVLGGKQ